MDNGFSEIMRYIKECDKASMLIAIDGRCAAGKTTLGALLKKEINCNIIHMDDFFLRREQRTLERMQEPGGNVDYERVLREVMAPISQGKSFSYQIFDCQKMELSSRIHVEPKPVTIIEGSYSCHPVLWDFYDLRVFLTIEPHKQLERIRQRNGKEAALKFSNRWIPLEESYFTAYRIQERCDVVVTIL